MNNPAFEAHFFLGRITFACNLKRGARKILTAFQPVVEECDIQLMTFMTGYTELEQKQEIWTNLKEEGHNAFPLIQAYAPARPYFQADHWVSSIKIATMTKKINSPFFNA